MQTSVYLQRITSILLVSILWTACNNAGEEGVLLQFRQQEGKQYTYAFTVEVAQEMEGRRSDFVVETTYDLAAKGMAGNGQEITGTYNRFFMKMNAGGMTMEIDTEKSYADQPAGDAAGDPTILFQRVFAGIKGRSFSLLINEKGELVKVNGTREMIQAILDEVQVNDDQKFQLEVALKDEFSEQAIKNQFGPFFAVFPNRVVKAGDTWETVVETKGRMAARYSSNYEVKSVDGDLVTIDVKSKVSAAGEDSIEGTQDGTIVLDASRGLLKTGRFLQDLKTGGEDMEMTIKGKVNIAGTVR